MRIKKKDLRKRLAQLPINYPAPTIDEEPFDYEREKDRVENFCKRLAHNEVEVRDAVLAEIPRFLKDVTRVFLEREKRQSNKKSPSAAAQSQSPEEKKELAELELLLLKLSLGIFYCFWHSDKPLVQHACAQRIAELIHAPLTSLTKALFIRCIIRVLCREWCKIDRYRMDKYMALVRKLMHEILLWLKGSFLAGTVAAASEEGEVSDSAFFQDARFYRHVVQSIQDLVDAQTSVGLLMHVCDISLDEFCRADLPVALFLRLAQDIPLFAMSKGNYVEKRVLDYFLSPIAGGRLHPEDEEDDAVDDNGDAVVRPGTKRQRREAREQQLAKEKEILPKMAEICQRFSVASTTVRSVRVMFAEAQLLIHAAAQALQPSTATKTHKISRQSRRMALDREVEEADANRIAVVLARRDKKLLRNQERGPGEDRPARKKQRKEAAQQLDDDDKAAAAAADPTAKKKRKDNKAPVAPGNVKRITKRRKEYVMSTADYENSGDDEPEEEY